MRETLEEYCLHHGREELLRQWHRQKNNDLMPDAVSFGSQRKIWWQCDKGHEWQSPPYARAEKMSGCPYCAGKKVSPGLDLRSLYPSIAAQWHPTKNGNAAPEQFLPGSHRSVWWRCGKGHEWKAMIKSRVEGSGCPICANRMVNPGENDLQTLAPMVAMQWHPTKNGAQRPDEVLVGSARKAWWRCEQGHEWQAEIHSRVMGSGCPVCAGKTIIPGENDLESLAPEVARQWHPENNGSLLPSQVSVASNRRVWWRCDKGHEWQAAVSSRTASNSACPYCANRKVLAGFNDLKTACPEVAAQWHPTLNGALEPTMVMAGSSKRIWWQCSDGHVWKAVVYSRTGAKKSGCPVCAGRVPKRHKLEFEAV